VSSGSVRALLFVNVEPFLDRTERVAARLTATVDPSDMRGLGTA
jgi:hypothetical protein